MSFTDFSCVIFGPKCKTCQHPQIYIRERLFIENASEKGECRNIMQNYLVVWAIVIRNECFMILLINYDQYIYKVSKKNTSFSFELHVNIEQLITQINKEKNSYSAFTIFARHQHIRLPLTFFTKHQWKTTTSSCFIFLKTIFKNNLTCYSNM